MEGFLLNRPLENGGGNSWIETIPEMHRNIFRGLALGNSVSQEQYQAIDSGIFDNLYVGDYWEISTTINNTIVNIKYRIADMNYWKGTQNNENIPNHLAIVPDTSLYTTTMYSSSYSDYTQSAMYNTNIIEARTAISTIFGNHLLTHQIQLSPTDTVYNSSTVDLMNLIMILGYIPPDVDSKVRYIDNKQLALFRICPEYIDQDPGVGFWTRDICVNSTAGQIINGRVGLGGSPEIRGVRPIFAIGTNSN